MKNFNHSLIIAALVRNPELRYTSQGTAVLNFQLGGDQTVIDSNGEFKNAPFYIKAEFAGKEAETLSETLQAGSVVAVEGKLEYQAWENENGDKVSRVIYRALSVQTVTEVASDRLVNDRQGGFRLANAINTISISGNLTKDAQVRFTPSGNSVSSLTVAVNESWKDVSGNWHEKAHFIEVVVWNDLAQKVEGLTKGQPVLVQGKIAVNSWTNNDGEKRSKLEISADRVEVLASRKAKAQPVDDEPPFVADATSAPTPKRGRKAAATA